MKKVIYSDDQLIQAVATAKNWAEVYLAIGFDGNPGGSTRQKVRDKITALGLSTSHIFSQRGSRRNWTDQDLIDAVNESSFWSEVVGKLNSSQKTAKAYADRIGIDVSRLDESNHRKIPVHTPLKTVLNPYSLRNAAEHMACFWYEMHGYELFKPTNDGGTDLLIQRDGVFSRVQVKSTTSVKGTVGIGRHSNSNGRVPYEEDAVDEFFIVRSDGCMFRIPAKVVSGKSLISLQSKYDEFIVDVFKSTIDGV